MRVSAMNPVTCERCLPRAPHAMLAVAQIRDVEVVEACTKNGSVDVLFNNAVDRFVDANFTQPDEWKVGLASARPAFSAQCYSLHTEYVFVSASITCPRPLSRPQPRWGAGKRGSAAVVG